MTAKAENLPWLRGWTLWFALTIAVGAGAALALTMAPGYEGIGGAIRLTARTSIALFLLAFTASALFAIWPGAMTSGLRANRRYLGLAFAASHAIHLAVIVAYWDAGVATFIRAQPYVGFIINIVVYAFITAMAVTSFAAPRRWIGPSAWMWLHTIGGYVVWLGFAKSYIPRALVDPVYWPAVFLLFAALALRLMARSMRARKISNAQAATLTPPPAA